MIKFNKKLTALVTQAGTDLNFYGKRMLATKEKAASAVIEQVNKACEDNPEVAAKLKDLAPSELVAWFEANKAEIKPKPEKKKAAVKVCDKPAADTMQGKQSHTEIDQTKMNPNGYIITSCQNNSEVVLPFLTALRAYALEQELTIMLGAVSYNMAAYAKCDDGSLLNHAPQLREHIVDKPTQLFKDLVFCGEMQINPTAKYPGTGSAGYHGDQSLIYPHNKIQLMPYPTGKIGVPKNVYSTGSITVPTFINRNAGIKAEKDHKIAALIVVPWDNAAGYQVRQIHWINDSFVDMGCEVFADGRIKNAPPATTLNFGDLHSEKMDYESLDKACALAMGLGAKTVVCHDTFDFTSRNHHNTANHLFIAAQGQTSIADDLAQAGDVLSIIGEQTAAEQILVVRSNHDEALDRWMTERNYDFRQDPINARLYLDLQSEAYRFIEEGQKVPDMFKVGLDTAEVNYPDSCVFLTRQEQTLSPNGIRLDMHGDSGNNGSRATPKQLSTTYDALTTGHTHQGSIYGGCYTAGVTGLLDMGYNTRSGGGSGWSQCHVVEYYNGSRAVIAL